MTKTSNPLPTSSTTYVGNGSQTVTRPPSSSSDVAKEKSMSPPSQKPGRSPSSTRVGNPSLLNSKGKKVPTEADALGTMALVAASTLNWVLVRILYLQLGTIGIAKGADYYEIRLPTAKWKHDNGVFTLVGNGVGSSEHEKE